MKIDLTNNQLQLSLCDAASFSYAVDCGPFVLTSEFALMFFEERRQVVLKAVIPMSVTVTECRAQLALFTHQFQPLERRAVALWFCSRMTKDPDLKPAIERAIETKRAELSTAQPETTHGVYPCSR